MQGAADTHVLGISGSLLKIVKNGISYNMAMPEIGSQIWPKLRRILEK